MSYPTTGPILHQSATVKVLGPEMEDPTPPENIGAVIPNPTHFHFLGLPREVRRVIGAHLSASAPLGSLRVNHQLNQEHPLTLPSEELRARNFPDLPEVRASAPPPIRRFRGRR